MGGEDVVVAYVIFAGIFGVVGAYLAYIGWDRLTGISELRGVDTSTISQLAGSGDVGKVTGEIRGHPTVSPFRAPFSDEECVYEEWVVAQKNMVTLSFLAGGEIEQGDQAVPCLLDDGHGVVEVDLPNIELLVLADERDLPDGVDARDDIRDQISDAGLLVDETTRQTVLPVGEEITVFGAVERAGEGSPARYRLTGFDARVDQRSVVTDQSDRVLFVRKVGSIGRLVVGGGLVIGVVFTYLGLLLNSDVVMEYATIVFVLAVVLGVVWQVLFVLYLEVKRLWVKVTGWL